MTGRQHELILVVASMNLGKSREIREVLHGICLKIISLVDLPAPPDLTEPHATFAANAAEKATTTARACGLLALADDSGLIVPALDGAPGVHSSRVAATDPERIAWLLQQMQGLRGKQRAAYFVCELALAAPTGALLGSWGGRVDGTITHEPRGDGGFGYDPVFLYPPTQQTFAEMSPEQKNNVSHRGHALRAFAQDVSDILERIPIQQVSP